MLNKPMLTGIQARAAAAVHGGAWWQALRCPGAVADCSKSDTAAQSQPAARNVTLTAAQRQNVRLVTVAAAKFHKTVDTTGIVDFDNDQATSVLAPISGPVTRLLVSPGDVVKQGDALAEVTSPDFATAIGGYRKALSAAQTSRRLADLDKDLYQHEGVAQREAEQAETDAAPADADRDAALQGLVSLGVDPRSIKDIQEGRLAVTVEGVIRAPIAGTVVEKLITPGQLLQAGTTPAFTIADLSKVWVMGAGVRRRPGRRSTSAIRRRSSPASGPITSRGRSIT